MLLGYVAAFTLNFQTIPVFEIAKIFFKLPAANKICSTRGPVHRKAGIWTDTASDPEQTTHDRLEVLHCRYNFIPCVIEQTIFGTVYLILVFTDWPAHSLSR